MSGRSTLGEIGQTSSEELSSTERFFVRSLQSYLIQYRTLIGRQDQLIDLALNSESEETCYYTSMWINFSLDNSTYVFLMSLTVRFGGLSIVGHSSGIDL